LKICVDVDLHEWEPYKTNQYTTSEEAFELTQEFNCRVYESTNLSLLFRTGGLNNVKGALSQDSRALDRFDVFIYVLNDYLSIEKEKRSNMHLIFSHAWKNSVDNRGCLEKYLSQFDRVVEYMKLANEYWSLRQEHILEIIGDKE